jgi:hypothetical protein
MADARPGQFRLFAQLAGAANGLMLLVVPFYDGLQPEARILSFLLFESIPGK